ncbi:MAG: helix-turn-helix domain-containing protein [Actinobacteria bacterium]|nr:helix-turn-helix domain-containing protein [Actinomycetota bacterium]
MIYSNKYFNLALKEVIEKKKIKLRSLANKTNLDYTYFSKLKNREKHPPINTIRIISNGLDLPPEYFLEYRIYKIQELLLENPELTDDVLSYIKNLSEKKKLKVAEKREPFKKN